MSRVAECVGSFNIDALAALVPSYRHRAIVVRVDYTFACSNRAEEGIGEHLGVRCLLASLSGVVDRDLWLVSVDEQPQLVTGRTLIVDFQRECGAMLTLNTEAVLVNVGDAETLVFRTDSN